MLDEAAELRAFLAERDVPCPKCGYNLRGLQSPTCPECSRPLTLEDVHVSAARLGPHWSMWSAIIAEAVVLAAATLIFRRRPAELLCPLICAFSLLGFFAVWALMSRGQGDPMRRRSELALAAWLGVAYTIGLIGILYAWARLRH